MPSKVNCLDFCQLVAYKLARLQKWTTSRSGGSRLFAPMLLFSASHTSILCVSSRGGGCRFSAPMLRLLTLFVQQSETIERLDSFWAIGSSRNAGFALLGLPKSSWLPVESVNQKKAVTIYYLSRKAWRNWNSSLLNSQICYQPVLLRSWFCTHNDCGGDGGGVLKIGLCLDWYGSAGAGLDDR